MLTRLFFITFFLCASTYAILAYGFSVLPEISIPAPAMHAVRQNAPDTVSLVWVGDMVPTTDAAYNSTVFNGVSDEINQADFAIGNVEGTFAEPFRTPKCSLLMPGCFAFRGNQSFINALYAAGFDAVNLVNNHSLDYGMEGLLDSETLLTIHNVPFISHTNPTNEFIINNKKIALFGVSSSPPAHTINDYAFIEKTILGLKTRNDIVVLIFHGGAEGPNKTIVPGVHEFQGDEDRGNVEEMAHLAVDAGADVVLGSGPHVLRKIEYYHHKLIAYSMGNFVGGNGRLASGGTLSISGILHIFIDSGGAITYRVTPIKLTNNGTPRIDPFNTAGILLSRLSQ